jgi:uncharacterized protein (DUF488 family)
VARTSRPRGRAGGETGAPKPPSPLALAGAQRSWNVERLDRLLRSRRRRFDFATAGTSGKEPEDLIELLRRPVFGTACVVDIRANPNSPHIPAWNREPLSRAIRKAGLEYVPRPDLGVPHELRSRRRSGTISDAELFDWYARSVATPAAVKALAAGLEGPPLLLCTELSPTYCHRHRLALALERTFDWVSYDL